jgi:leucyl aminopeptidase (aminopeptidase T)
MTNVDALLEVDVAERTLAAARNATATCLSAGADDRAVIVYDGSTREIAAALLRAFGELETKVTAFDMDQMGKRPLNKLPAEVVSSLRSASVSAAAVTTMQGELSARRTILDTVGAAGLRHAHMPSITTEVFEDALAMDYREVSRFIEHLVETITATTSLTMTSAGGTHLEFTYPSPPLLQKLDGLISTERWQNLPSGQVIIYPTDANGVYVVDRTLGDWFEHKYDIAEHPVTFEFENGMVRSLRCDNKRLERDLWVYIRSSENSGRISELVIGANLWLTQGHTGALYEGYRPGASLAIGSLDPDLLGWQATTFLPMVGIENSIVVGGRQIMVGDAFTDDILAHFDKLRE